MSRLLNVGLMAGRVGTLLLQKGESWFFFCFVMLKLVLLPIPTSRLRPHTNAYNYGGEQPDLSKVIFKLDKFIKL